MPTFRVSTATGRHVEVEAANWLVALGTGLGSLGETASPDRLACERLLNGTVLVRDMRSGAGFVIQPLDRDGQGAPIEQEEEPMEMGPTLSPADFEGEEEEEVGDLDSDAVIPLELVRDTLASIERAMDPDAAMALAVGAAVKLTGARGGSAIVLEAAGLRFRYVMGEHASRLYGMRIPVGAGVAGFSVNTHTSLIVLNPYADPRFYRNVDRHTGHRTRSLLCVPMAAGGRTWGCLECVDSVPGFTDDALADVERLAEGAAERMATLASIPLKKPGRS